MKFFYLQQAEVICYGKRKGKGMKEKDLQIDQWAMPPWLEKTIQYVDTQLNWLDLAFFGLGIILLGVIFFIIFRKKKRIHVEEIATICETYENDIQEIKLKHLEEIEKAEESIRTFRKKLEGIEAEYEESLKEQELSYSKRFQKMEKGHSEILSTDELTIYEMKEEVERLRAKQVNELEVFEGEVKKLKEEIKYLHEGHAKEIEMGELEIAELRKQIRALMYRV